MYKYLGSYYRSDGECDVGKGVSLEFALFTTVFVCALGVAAFLALTLSVERDRRVYSEQLPLRFQVLFLTCRQWRGLV